MIVGGGKIHHWKLKGEIVSRTNDEIMNVGIWWMLPHYLGRKKPTYFPSYVIRDLFGGRLCWVLRLSLTPCVLQDHPHVGTCESVCVSYRLPLLQFTHSEMINNSKLKEHYDINIIGVTYIIKNAVKNQVSKRIWQIRQSRPHDLNRSSVCNVASSDDSIGRHIWVHVPSGHPEDPFSWLLYSKADLDGLLLII